MKFPPSEREGKVSLGNRDSAKLRRIIEFTLRHVISSSMYFRYFQIKFNDTKPLVVARARARGYSFTAFNVALTNSHGRVENARYNLISGVAECREY